jgi:DNA-binding PadR family transcriptional regulator
MGKSNVWLGTLALMVLKTLENMGPQHGYGIARRIEKTSADLLTINQGTLYPVLLKLEQEAAIASDWGLSDNNRKASSIGSLNWVGNNCWKKHMNGSR